MSIPDIAQYTENFTLFIDDFFYHTPHLLSVNMTSTQKRDFVRSRNRSIENIEGENRWYSSVFKLLKSSEFRCPDSGGSLHSRINPLFECTQRYLDGILKFRSAAFYLAESSENKFSLKYWEPATREKLFRRQVATIIKKVGLNWVEDPERSYVYNDEASGTSLTLQPMATSNHFFGVFAGMYEDGLSPERSQEALSKVKLVLQNLAQVMEGMTARNLISQGKETQAGPSPVSRPSDLGTPVQEWTPAEPRRSGAFVKQHFHDILTDLPNRELVEDRLNMALAHARYSGEKVAVLVLDVDNFKRVNDFLGISSGDLLLKSLSKRIRKCLREEDTLGRLGGDEFILLLPDIHLIQDIEYRVQKIMERVRGSFQLNGQEIHASCSVGISVYPDDGEDSPALVKMAKAAMCQAKEEGKDRYQFFKPFMLSKGYQQMNLEGALHKALGRGEFCLHFQPKMSIQSGAIQGMEALLRWNHPERGLIYPSEFIPLAEEMGLIQPIGEWVFLSACRQIKAWKRAGFPPISIAVNLSGYQVNQPHWISKVRSILDMTGVEPKYLELEITETVLMENSDVALSNLFQLQEMGFRISIDDFGTGYSSLSYLKRFPIHALKIDRSFIRGISERRQGTDAVITKAIVSLAQALNLKTVAEGVEQVQEKEYLQSIGCDDMQGYLFSKPLPVERINFMFTRNLKNPVRSYWRQENAPQMA
jgi:diguanylate cyclase (GGDEF)-like protein